MDLDANSLIVSMIISSIGFVAFVYGKKQQRIPQLGIGLLLMIYPYFVTNVLLMAGIGVLLVGGLVALVKLGY